MLVVVISRPRVAFSYLNAASDHRTGSSDPSPADVEGAAGYLRRRRSMEGVLITAKENEFYNRYYRSQRLRIGHIASFPRRNGSRARRMRSPSIGPWADRPGESAATGCGITLRSADH